MLFSLLSLGGLPVSEIDAVFIRVPEGKGEMLSPFILH